MKRSCIYRMFSVSAFAFLVSASVIKADVVVLNGLETTLGGYNNASPFFSTATDDFDTQRYQQVYAASEFAGPINIGKIAFRVYVGDLHLPFSFQADNIRIDLSTTPSSPDGLNSNFAANVGADDTIVYGGSTGSSLLLSSPGGSTFDFNIVINLTTPFLYDPSLGNLLMDVRNGGGGTAVSGEPSHHLDAVNGADGVSRMVSDFAPNGVSLATGNRDSLGLVTDFRVADSTTSAATPLPATFQLGAVFLTLVAAGRLIFRKQTSSTFDSVKNS